MIQFGITLLLVLSATARAEGPQAALERACLSLSKGKAQSRAAATTIADLLPRWISGGEVFPTATVAACLADKRVKLGAASALAATWLDSESSSKTLPKLLSREPNGEFARISIQLSRQLLAKGDLASLARLEKRGWLPGLERERLAFSNGRYAEAAALADSIPESAPGFLASRSDLGWALVHLGRWDRLRGLVEHLNTLVPARDRLEGRVLSAISALQSCDYARNEKEIVNFQTEMKEVAHEIRAGRASLSLLPPGSSPALISLGEAYQGLGYDKSFARSRTELRAKLERRHEAAWDRYEALASEAVLKMRFVRLELLTHLNRISREKGLAPSLPAKGTAENERNRLTFADTHDYWSDEMFKLNGASQNLCARFAGLHGGGKDAL